MVKSRSVKRRERERERERERWVVVGGGGEGERGRSERKGYLSNNQFIIADHQESFKS